MSLGFAAVHVKLARGLIPIPSPGRLIVAAFFLKVEVRWIGAMREQLH